MLAADLFFAFQAYMRGLIENPTPNRTEIRRKLLVERASIGSQTGSNPLTARDSKRIADAAIRNGVPIALGRRPIQLPIEHVEVSSSHVLRLSFRPKDIKLFLEDFENDPVQARWFVHEP